MGASFRPACAVLFAGASFAVALGLAVACAAEGDGAPRGFAGLGEAAEGFAQPAPGRPLRFPRDYGQHPNYRIEWWYLTANLKDASGEQYGVQWTLFRQASAPRDQSATEQRNSGDVSVERPLGWRSPDLWMAHAAATSADAHFFEERLARGGVGQAGAAARPFEAWLDDWSLRALPGAVGVEGLRLEARGEDFAYRLALRASGPIALQGRQGYSVKSLNADGSAQASYYYSQPSYQVSGILELNGREIPVSGKGWLDREWSSQPLSPAQIGWDWFSLHLGDGAKVMLFQLRRRDGAPPDLAGSWIDASGAVTPLAPEDIRITPLDSDGDGKTRAPRRWRLAIPSRGLDVRTDPLNGSALQDGLFPYWEGPIRLSGSHTGVGYLEMTGYRR